MKIFILPRVLKIQCQRWLLAKSEIYRLIIHAIRKKNLRHSIHKTRTINHTAKKKEEYIYKASTKDAQ